MVDSQKQQLADNEASLRNLATDLGAAVAAPNVPATFDQGNFWRVPDGSLICVRASADITAEALEEAFSK